MKELKNLEKLRPHVKELIVPYAQGLLSLAADDIQSFLVFGSATGPDFMPGRSNVNSAVLVREFSPALLRMCLKHVRGGYKKRIVAPIFLTRSYIESSLDVFPIEFLDMRTTGIVLFGEDFLAEAVLSNSNLRLECERELKGALLRIRQAYLELGLEKRGLETVLCDSVNSLIPTFRGLLVLKGVATPRGKEQIVLEVCKAFGIPEESVLPVIRLKLKPAGASPRDVTQFFEAYLKAIGEFVRIVDSIETKEQL